MIEYNLIVKLSKLLNRAKVEVRTEAEAKAKEEK